MIEIKHACKTYVTKTGVSTTAINDVSFKLPNKGMVFLVGKSGAGKSTLLNVLGGLDYLDSGEIIVNGKSTKDFTKSEYDSYRNTYVGFVFQEFHIIDTLTVGENIALAIKLQNKKPNKELVAFILDEVGLEGYMDRWPNELSGGQLQRVAIARALIKKPEIIIADEPIGSLDSNTGQQIFETLKLLSNTHLVLVVSHDLEFARQYGDRIIEVKDGKVVGDIESKINKRNKKSSFVPTTEQISNEKEQPLKLIKSKMPLKEATRMGSSALLHKKFRLFASIFLSIISFTMLGLSSVIGFYNNVDVCSRTFSQYPVINFASYEKILVSSNQELGYLPGYFGEEDKKILSESIGIPFTILTESYYSFENNLSNEAKDKFDIRYAKRFPNTTYIPEDKLSEYNIDIIAGKAPTQKNEIAISKYTYETFNKYGYFDGTKTIPIDAPEEVINKQLSGKDQTTYTITAVYDTHFDNHNKDLFDKVWKKSEEKTIMNATGWDEYCDCVNTLAGAMFISYEPDTINPNLEQKIVGVIKDKENNRAVKKMYDFAFSQHNSTEQDKQYSSDEYKYAQYSLTDTVTNSALDTIQRASFLRKIFLSFGIAFVIFSGLLLGNFIANSISYQRKEIGILRAIGARSVDIFKIYSVESLIISIINFVLSTLVSFLVFNFVFEPILMQGVTNVALYSFTYIQVIIILLVSIVSALIATFIPVKLATRQKPIDAIRLK